MIYFYIAFVSSFAIQLLNAHSVIRNNDLQISYHGTMKNTCDVEEYRFQAIVNSKLSDCVIECAIREHCAVMNYRPDQKLCELHQNSSGTSNLTGNCFRVEREDIHITQLPCKQMACPNGTTCDIRNATCQIKECLEVPRLNNGRVRGNLRAVGNQIKYECDEGYHLLDSLNEVAECLENGTWSATGECVIDYIASAVGKRCSLTNCLDPSARCVKKWRDGHKYCHCNFGFEYDQSLGMCVKVCRNYSTNPSDFEGQSGHRIWGYKLNSRSGFANTSVEECVRYCTKTHPLYLSINIVNDTKCFCNSISEQQQLLAHATLNNCQGCYFFNRPCDVPVET